MADDKLIELEKKADALIEKLGSDMPIEQAIAELNLAGLEVEKVAAMRIFADYMETTGVERPLMTFGMHTINMQQAAMKDAMEAAKKCEDPKNKASLLNVVIQAAKVFPDLSDQITDLQEQVRKKEKKSSVGKNAPPNVMQVVINTEKAHIQESKPVPPKTFQDASDE
jgi:flagellar hook-basal body complex protein FliE